MYIHTILLLLQDSFNKHYLFLYKFITHLYFVCDFLSANRVIIGEFYLISQIDDY